MRTETEVVTAHCEKHGEYQAAVIAMPWGGKINAGCPACLAEEEAAGRDRERVDAEKARQEAFLRANIEPEFYGATLENYDPRTESQRRALEAVRRMTVRRCGKILLTGGNGVGKTHLACAAAKELSGAVYTMYEISARIRQTYTARAQESELDVVRSLSCLPFLAVDEIGRTKGGEAEHNWLSYIIDKRHVRGLPVMLLSNRRLARDLPAENRSQALEAFIDSDVVSRFRADGEIIAVDGRDYRLESRIAN